MATKKAPTTPAPKPRRGNPPDSEWYATPGAKRTRPSSGFTLTRETFAAIEAMQEEDGLTRTQFVEKLIAEEVARRAKAKAKKGG
jgi:hypothetical protein